MPRQIQGSQHDFSFGEVDPELKRNDDHPARKGGLRQMANARILNSGAFQNRSGRRALFPVTNSCSRIEKFTISAGNDFKIAFGPGRVQISNNVGAVLFNFANQGNGAALPWVSAADINSIVYTLFNQTITVCFGHAMRPQVISWDGVATWSIADYTELVIGGQKRTPFYRISPQAVTITPSGLTGAITVAASAPVFTPAHVGTRIRFVNRQILITGFGTSQSVSATVEESLPGSQELLFLVDPSTSFSVGDVVLGSVSGSKGIVTSIPGSDTVVVQLISENSTVTNIVTPFGQPDGTNTFAFVGAETIAGPGGGIANSSVSVLGNPVGCAVWDDEVMNPLRGFPASCFTDQFRLGFCDFPAVPGGVGWSAINAPADFYPNEALSSDNAIFEIAPGKVRVLYVVPGPESSEFVFCDSRLYYIPISPTNPLAPGRVGFQILSGDGCAHVQPRISQEVILYVNGGASSVMAVIATGAYYRPFNTKDLSQFHQHLFSAITAIAVPNADATFNERYAYVRNGDGSLVVGKYTLDDVTTTTPKIGWGPWSGAGAVSWVSAWNGEVHFTSSYFGVPICEVLDDTMYLDATLRVNAPPAAFVPPGGKGPLWFIPGQSVTLMDQVTRAMGAYQIDANGFIIPQGNGGENLAAASLVAGQPWTMIAEPFPVDAASGTDMHQRMTLRQISNFGVSFINSTGFKFASLFSSKQTPTSPPLGAITNTRRVPAWNQGDDATKPPPLRESVEFYPPQGSSFDPRVAIIKDTPGPLGVLEISMEITL